MTAPNASKAAENGYGWVLGLIVARLPDFNAHQIVLQSRFGSKQASDHVCWCGWESGEGLSVGRRKLGSGIMFLG